MELLITMGLLLAFVFLALARYRKCVLSELDQDQALGRIAFALTRIPPEGIGKIEVVVNGDSFVRPATASEDIPKGCTVVVNNFKEGVAQVSRTGSRL